MSYYNRLEQLKRTLNTIALSSLAEKTEIIIVDDNSSPESKFDYNEKSYPFNIKYIDIKENEKWWNCPCIPYNIGFKQTEGDIIVIQNPECFHYGDVLLEIQNNIKSNDYLSCLCYCISKTETQNITHLSKNYLDAIIKPFEQHITKPISDGSEKGWYNHPQYRPCMYHFLSAITKTDLDKLQGFDPRYAMGIAFDDDEFILRIKKSGMNVRFIGNEHCCAIHQWHEHSKYPGVNVKKALALNQAFYNYVSRFGK